MGVGLIAAACGSDAVDTTAQTTTTEAVTTTEAMAEDETTTSEAMADDEEAMEDDEEAMADEEEAMEDEDGRPVLELNFDGLEPLGDDFNYEGWVVVDGTPISTGVFDIAEDGSIEADGTFYGHENSEAVVISIEHTAGIQEEPAIPTPSGLLS